MIENIREYIFGEDCKLKIVINIKIVRGVILRYFCVFLSNICVEMFYFLSMVFLEVVWCGLINYE